MQCGLETHQDTFLSIGSRPHFWIFNKTLSSKPSTVSSKTPRENSTLKMRRLHIEGEGSCLGPLICTVCSEMGLMKLLKKQPLGLWKYMRFDVSLCLQLNVLLLSVLCSRIRWILGYFIFFTIFFTGDWIPLERRLFFCFCHALCLSRRVLMSQ